MPHGLTIDSEGNFWITDVGSHQVLILFLPSRLPNVSCPVSYEYNTGGSYEYSCVCIAFVITHNALVAGV